MIGRFLWGARVFQRVMSKFSSICWLCLNYKNIERKTCSGNDVHISNNSKNLLNWLFKVNSKTKNLLTYDPSRTKNVGSCIIHHDLGCVISNGEGELANMSSLTTIYSAVTILQATMIFAGHQFHMKSYKYLDLLVHRESKLT